MTETEEVKLESCCFGSTLKTLMGSMTVSLLRKPLVYFIKASARKLGYCNSLQIYYWLSIRCLDSDFRLKPWVTITRVKISKNTFFP